MRALISPFGALCAVHDGDHVSHIFLNDLSEIPESVFARMGTANGEWHVATASSREELIHKAKQLSEVLRATSNIEACLSGLTTGLVARLLTETEDIFKTQNVGRDVLARLMRAPLADISVASALRTTALSKGLGFVANLLEQCAELQPHLRRLVSTWLDIPSDRFRAFSAGPSQVWNIAVARLIILDSLTAKDRSAFNGHWGRIAFEFRSPLERIGIAEIIKIISSVLFPQLSQKSVFIDETEGDFVDASLPRRSAQFGAKARQAQARALAQVDAIVRAVASGEDQTARRYLEELKRDQLAYEDGERHAIKSLCNIAKSCADMFRVDFEHYCLELALDLAATDSWTLLQMADHLKRAGHFDEALKAASDAETYGKGSDIAVARSVTADIYVHMEHYDRAVEKYHSIAEWHEIATVRTALAGILRKQAKYPEARQAYEALIAEGLAGDRAYAGLAEIAKCMGDFGEAIRCYQVALSLDGLDENARRIYLLGQSHVMLRAGDYVPAYNIVDKAVQTSPFDARARVTRAAIAGILGNADDAIKDLPSMGQTRAFNEWVYGYVRGLTLLMLNRNADARAALFAQIDKTLLDRESEATRMLATAVFFLRSRSTVDEADSVLNKISGASDAFSFAIRDVLAYHVAVSRGRVREMEELAAKLANVDDDDLRELRVAISRREWQRVKPLEVKLLLRLAS